MTKQESTFSDIHNAMLVATFFSLWLAVYFESSVQDFLAYILILTFGILHGSNDLTLIQFASGKEGQVSYFRILLYYVAFVLVVAALFFLIPSVALLLFVLLSAYHFGEQHWVNKADLESWKAYLFYSIYGLLVLFLLFSAHGLEVSKIIFDITNTNVPIWVYDYGLGVGGLLSFVLYGLNLKQFNTNVLLELFYLGVFFVVFHTASLLWSFAIYFIIWHSIPSLIDQTRYLYGGFKKANLMKYIKSSFAYWLISVLALVGLFGFLGQESRGFLPFLFSFLAAITFPHVFVINKLYKS